MLRIGLVSAWHVHFDQYASELAERDDCTITALWDDDAARGQTAAAKYGCAFEPDYETFLAREDVDGVVITSATNLHPGLLIKAAEAGKHIFTEKVLTVGYHDACRVGDAVKKNGIKFCISYPYRCREQYLAVKNALREGLLGEITYARVRNTHNGAIAGWLPEHFFDPVACGGGAMMDLGAHPMYFLYDMFGMPDSVMSFFKNITGHQVEDSALSVLEFGNVIACSETGFVSGGDPFTLEVSGTNGYVRWNVNQNELVILAGGQPYQPALPKALKRPADQWADGVLYGGEIAFGIDDAVALTKMMECAYRSAKTGEKVAFD